MNQQEILQQLQAAVALHNKGELDQAELIYRNVLAVEADNFHALRFLGCLCRLKGAYVEGIDLLRKAVSLRPSDVDCIYNLGNILSESGSHQQAISVLESCLVLREEFAEAKETLGWSLFEIGEYLRSEEVLVSAVANNSALFQAWVNLGNTYKELKKLDQAIASYRKAVEVKPDFADAYLCLGNVLKEEGEVKEAIVSYRKAIEVKPDFADAYLSLGNVLKEEGEVEEAIVSYRKAVEVKPDFAEAYLSLGNVLNEVEDFVPAAEAFAAHYRLNPIALNFSFTSVSTSLPSNSVAAVKVPESAEFISSYISNSIPFGMHLLYVHIPKTGGVRFSNPLFGCIQELLLERGWEKYSDLTASAFGRESLSFMAARRIDSAPILDGIVDSFPSCEISALNFSFLTPHGVPFRELVMVMQEQFGVQPIRLATWRDPRKRLKSALDYLYRTLGGDLDLVRCKINQKDPFLDNAIYRGCFSNFLPVLSPDDLCDIQVDHLIDIGDFSVMNQVMSSFLSRCRLPNVIVNKRVNATSVNKKMDAVLADALMAQCEEAGFLSLDCASEIEQMISRELPSELNLHLDYSSASLHPITFVFNAVTEVKTSARAWLLPTEYLMTGQGQEFLRKIFAE